MSSRTISLKYAKNIWLFHGKAVQGTGQCPAEKPRLARSLRKMGRTLTCPLSRYADKFEKTMSLIDKELQITDNQLFLNTKCYKTIVQFYSIFKLIILWRTMSQCTEYYHCDLHPHIWLLRKLSFMYNFIWNFSLYLLKKWLDYLKNVLFIILLYIFSLLWQKITEFFRYFENYS